MELKLNIKNTENIGEVDREKLSKIQEIVEALIVSGGLTGVKGGKTLIHFDGDGTFQGIELDYWPFRKRKKDY